LVFFLFRINAATAQEFSKAPVSVSVILSGSASIVGGLLIEAAAVPLLA